MSSESNLPVLTAEEVRVLGVLIEKSKTTPEYYPMSLNAITAASNQKTSRQPVVNYDENTVLHALNELKAQSLVAMAIGGGSRTMKYKHNFNTVFEVSPEEMAILCLLMLRGPQTPGELNTNGVRLATFASLDSVLGVLNKLQESQPAFVRELPKRPGQKEARYVHLLSGDRSADQSEPELESPIQDLSSLEERIEQLEKELAQVKADINKLSNDQS